jgi:hypothetical protein
MNFVPLMARVSIEATSFECTRRCPCEAREYKQHNVTGFANIMILLNKCISQGYLAKHQIMKQIEDKGNEKEPIWQTRKRERRDTLTP